ncbi:hypothetical protein RHSIM_Rhsim03G0212400 [Rhododendron simsii]|uniref:AAA+ ATPase domain-containing protein n=1 Tax=Rhododendron simsii TaxID=118357 RepID=A0A834HAP7_RHOSS|nr:hypothetical protein RHSIM_Rhsim03G0212400 [Rhododendron simsii]
MLPPNPILLLAAITASYLLFRFLYKTSVLQIVRNWCRLIADKCHVHQTYRIPQFNEHMQENHLYRKVFTYLNSLPAVEDSDGANLFAGPKPNDIVPVLDDNQALIDAFLGARVHWTNERSDRDGSRALVLRIRRKDKRRILRPYLQHIHATFEDIDQRKKEVKLYLNAEERPERNGRWRSVPFTHPSTIETVAMDSDVKNKIKSDMESFLKSRQYYHRLGRVWKRSYLLYGPSGTGKSSFVAGMAKFLSYDVYDVDLSNVSDDSDLKMLLLHTTNKSLIVIEDLDRYLAAKPTAVSLSGILNFMDGIFSCCGEERVMVFTMNGKDQIDPTVLRPGRIDVHVYFPLCDFSAFKTLASSHLGLKEHKLFPQVEEVFQTGASLSPAEIGEIMISNRTSPSRAIKTVITALQSNSVDRRGSGNLGQRLTESSSGRSYGDPGECGTFFTREGSHTMKEFRKLYGLLRMRSGRKNSEDLDLNERENSRHEIEVK